MRYLIWLLFPAVVSGATDFSAAQWEQISNEDRIKIFKWDVPNSQLIAFRGETVIDESPAKVASVIADITRLLEWAPNTLKAVTIKEVSPVERYDYIHIGTPFIVKDRDFVLRGSASRNEQNGIVTMNFESVKSPKGPSSDYVRGEIHASKYVLRPLGPKKTGVTFLVHVDPKGSVPKWMVNLFQRKFPRKNLEGLRRQAHRSDIKILPAVKRLMPELEATIP